MAIPSCSPRLAAGRSTGEVVATRAPVAPLVDGFPCRKPATGERAQAVVSGGHRPGCKKLSPPSARHGNDKSATRKLKQAGEWGDVAKHPRIHPRQRRTTLALGTTPCFRSRSGERHDACMYTNILYNLAVVHASMYSLSRF